ncbi:MAG: hypothetical protein ACPGSP_04670 [Alphaproteobacteria bacterium]|nr:hypothetical protein [Geminicoccus sp.]HCH99279.1 hypothetical protein [Alphaproteobacteria bacterium]|tara:strand:+ start:373 stop:567 length:195 start_codon:yes stop_codon:yes gene_type:complete
MKIWAVSALLAALAIFAFFFASVASGAFLGAAWLSDVGEMLVLVLACVLFVASTLMFEAIRHRE